MKRLLSLLVVILVAGAAAYFWWQTSIQAVNVTDNSGKIFVIEKGAGIKEIAKELKDKNLIRDQVAFFVYVKVSGLEKKIQAGDFRLTPSMTIPQLADALTHGTLDVWITIPEGWRSEEIIDYLTTQGFPKNDTGNTTNTNIESLYKSDEGKLFPDTYLVPRGATLEGIKRMMVDNFSKKVNFPVSREQLIVASMVEREARTEEDRPIVAGIIYNRLKRGMSLDIDATVQYVIGYTPKDKWWKKELTLEDLKIQSPYNTYQNTSLPPGPICNPGLFAIRAAANPVETDYLFYISDKSGNMHYAKTLSEHNQNVARYL